ncbi:MAG: hypothetical protein Tsb002_21310 [Wenzhouxiangellaceae bacterium]
MSQHAAPQTRSDSRSSGQTIPGLTDASSSPVAKALKRVLRGPTVQAKSWTAANTDAYERQADQVASAVLGISGAPGGMMLSAAPAGVQRKCSLCEDEQRRKLNGMIMRKCACGAGPGEDCSCSKMEDDRLNIDRKAAGSSDGRGRSAIDDVSQVVRRAGRPLESGVRSDMEQRFGHNFGQVRVHDDAQAASSARGIAAHAYTVGNHIVFGQGQYQPGTRNGRFLLAHELAHTIQQSGGQQLQPAGSISKPHDAHERQADAAAAAVLGQRPVPMLSPTSPHISRYSFGEFLDDVGSAAGYIADGAEELADSVVEGAEWAWDKANEFANAVGSFFSFSGGVLTINIPEFDPCPEFDAQFSLGDLGLAPTAFIPVFVGVLPLTGIVNLYGAFGFEVTLDPEIGVQLMGCSVGPSTITIDPLGMSISASSGYSVTGALSLGAQIDLGAHGEVGVMLVIPDPPVVLTIPVAGLTIGGTAQGRAIGAGTIAQDVSASVGLGSYSTSSSLTADLALGADLGVGAFGSVEVLGQTLCRLNWPLYEWHDSIAGHLELDFDLDISTSGVSASISIATASLPASPFDTLPLALDRSVLEDDCPLCDALYSMGLMPSQNGGSWSGHPAPAFGGPLHVYPKDPGITSGALCRGVCGVDCAEGSCTDPEDKYVCEEVGEFHFWHLYSGYIDCGSHQGCRDHDACYDWAAVLGEGGLAGVIFGPLHRLCDFECLCGFGAPTCVGWATGNGPYDATMSFADAAMSLPGCRGPCPEPVGGGPGGGGEDSGGEDDEAGPGGGGPGLYRICLDDIPLFDRQSLSDSWLRESGRIEVVPPFQIPVPYIRAITVGIDAYASIFAMVEAGLGPVALTNVCLEVDPSVGVYRGTADLHAQFDVGGSLTLTGSVDAWASDFLCLLRVASIEGGLSATGRIDLNATGIISNQVEVGCDGGDISLLNSLTLRPCVDLGFDLDAFMVLRLFGFNVLSERWRLTEAQWDKCWEMAYQLSPMMVGATPILAFGAALLNEVDLLNWLFDESGHNPGISRTPPDPARDRGMFNPCGGGGGDDPPGLPPANRVPTGLTATADDAIPMRWYKPEASYPQTVSLAVAQGPVCSSDSDCGGATPTCRPLRMGSSNGRIENRCVRNRDFEHDTPSPLPGLTGRSPTTNVGVAFYPGLGDIVELDPTPRSGSAQRRFNNRFARHGHRLQDHSEEPDHVLDLDWNGADDFTNLWPLDGALNQAAGREQNLNQRVTFSEGPPTDTVHNDMTLRTFKQQGFHTRSPPHRFFRIVRVQAP